MNTCTSTKCMYNTYALIITMLHVQYIIAIWFTGKSCSATLAEGKLKHY